MPRTQKAPPYQQTAAANGSTSTDVEVPTLSNRPQATADVHVMGEGIVCKTDARGYATPEGRSLADIVINVPEGFIRLWARNTTLRWRFQEQSLNVFEDPALAKVWIKNLMSDALRLWGDAVPVRFSEQHDLWDFEVAMVPPDCDANGCVLASAFFPDGGRHQINLYPTMFSQSRTEQVETMAHEFGHVFGLRHFFANVSEEAFPFTIFGTHDRFTIMNYGVESRMTDADRSDLRALYQSAWDGTLTEINGTEIRLVRPFHVVINPTGPLFLANAFPPMATPITV
jgi:hypothetical protein